jgi:hypothetical protein
MSDQLKLDDLFAAPTKPSEPKPPIAGFVGYDEAGRFVHYCHCGKWATFGVGVSMKENKFGRWFCGAHKP